MTDILNKHAVEFVQAQQPGKPFCLYLAHKAVHGPFTPAERHKGLYENDPFKPSPSVSDDRSGKPAITENAEKGKPAAKPGGPEGKFPLMRNQMRCLASIDEGVGELLKALEETKQLDNTVVVFTSDNGYFWGEHWSWRQALGV